MTPRWLTSVLRLAGLYNLLWGTLVILFPLKPFEWAGIEPPNYPQLWQCIGMIVGVYGIGYWIAAKDVARHWPIVLVGLLGKVLGPIGMVWYLWRGELPAAIVWSCALNDVIWWIPFGAALWHAFSVNSSPRETENTSAAELISTLRSQQGQTLAELSAKQPVLVTCLRHAGCTFCREALADLSAHRSELDRAGVKLALVHLSRDEDFAPLADSYKLGDVARFADPDARIYRALGLARGKFWQLLGPRIWWRGFLTAIVARHGFGRILGDGFQMPGLFLIDHGAVVASYRHATAADRPDYVAICSHRASS